MKLRIALIAFLAVGVAAAIIASSGGGGGGGTSGSAPQSPPKGSVVVSFAYSPEKEILLKPLIAQFNASAERVAGRRVFVRGEVVSSGEAADKIARGRLRPVAWSPASSLWGRLLNFEADRPYVASDNPSIVRTPLVIAMWEPMARALGWPRRHLGFEDVLRLARDARGWSRYGHPEYGSFKLVHTNPDFSTSGLEAVVAEYYAATGKKEGLRLGDLAGPAREKVREIERSIVHYGDTTLFIADQMRQDGPGYASAAAMEEVTLIDFNRRRRGQPRLVALYPKEGTFFSDNPLIVLRAPWVSERQREAAEAFQRFLAERVTPEVAAHGGFRPADVKTAPIAPVTPRFGADPRQPQRVLGLPEPRVVDRLKDAWRHDRKPANVLLVVDTSGSMNQEDRLERAKDGLRSFLAQVQSQDRLGLTTFSDQIRPLVPVAPGTKPRIAQTVRGLFADGGTAVYDATAEAVSSVRSSADTSRINAVVVLTDGEDTDSSRTADEVAQALRAQGDSARRVRVFTIAYSADAAGSAEGLELIAGASGGKAYTGDTTDIETVYKSISSFF